jgi:hypothetical protein
MGNKMELPTNLTRQTSAEYWNFPPRGNKDADRLGRGKPAPSVLTMVRSLLGFPLL